MAGYFGGIDRHGHLADHRNRAVVSGVVFDSHVGRTLEPKCSVSEQGGQRIYIAMVVIGITGWPGIARLTRGEVLKQRSLDYTLAAQALGRVELANHVSPHSAQLAFAGAGVGAVRHFRRDRHEASLSLLGFGAEPGQPSWGRCCTWPTKTTILVARRVSVAGDLSHRHGVQPRRQRPARRDGPAAENLTNEDLTRSRAAAEEASMHKTDDGKRPLAHFPDP